MKTQKQRMIDGKLYMGDEELREDTYQARRNMLEFNKLITKEEITSMESKIFGSYGNPSY
ncbi:maltose acetyltransferase domain-containing protein [Anaerococcus cruorum]|uniref:Maltose acetyltransferase domain-containing protein n=1 Tax=Anaerococcus cruorum TaxID=3115617 RepID=A0ABW9MV39_9FIRM